MPAATRWRQASVPGVEGGIPAARKRRAHEAAYEIGLKLCRPGASIPMTVAGQTDGQDLDWLQNHHEPMLEKWQDALADSRAWPRKRAPEIKTISMKTNQVVTLALIPSALILMAGASPLWGRGPVPNGEDLSLGVHWSTNADGTLSKQQVTLHGSSLFEKLRIAENPKTEPAVLSALAKWCIQKMDGYAPDRLKPGSRHPYPSDDLDDYGMLSALFYTIAMKPTTPLGDLQAMSLAKQKWGPGLGYSHDMLEYLRRHQVTKQEFEWPLALMGEHTVRAEDRMSWDPFVSAKVICEVAGVEAARPAPSSHLLPLKYEQDGMNLIMLSENTYANMPDEILEAMLTKYIAPPEGVDTHALKLAQERMQMIQVNTATLKPLNRRLMEKAVADPDANVRVAALYNPWVPLDLLVKGMADNYDDFMQGVPVAITNLFPGIDPAKINQSFLGADAPNSLWQRLPDDPTKVRRNARACTKRALFEVVGADDFNTAYEFLLYHQGGKPLPPGSPLKTPFGQYVQKVFQRGTSLTVSAGTLQLLRENSTLLLNAPRVQTVATGKVDADVKAAIQEVTGASVRAK